MAHRQRIENEAEEEVYRIAKELKYDNERTWLDIIEPCKPDFDFGFLNANKTK